MFNDCHFCFNAVKRVYNLFVSLSNRFYVLK
ncbi:hypothetical protein [Flavobacterium sp. YO12]